MAMTVSRPATTGTAGAAARLVEAVFALLTSQPTLLTIDDVHWSDASTVAVLDYVSQRARAEPLVVVATARDDEPERLARLPIADGRRFQRLSLGRLSREQVAQKLQLLLGAAVDDGTARRGVPTLRRESDVRRGARLVGTDRDPCLAPGPGAPAGGRSRTGRPGSGRRPRRDRATRGGVGWSERSRSSPKTGVPPRSRTRCGTVSLPVTGASASGIRCSAK